MSSKITFRRYSSKIGLGHIFLHIYIFIKFFTPADLRRGVSQGSSLGSLIFLVSTERSQHKDLKQIKGRLIYR